VKHSKEDALGELEFERLLDGARRMRDYYGDQAEFLVLVLGRLGLRRGELAHMDENWLNRRDQTIEIPSHRECHGERQGDGPCGYCVQLAKGRAERCDDLPLDEALGYQWRPKTAAAVRGVYYGHLPRVEYAIENFFADWDEFVWSAQAVNRRIDRAAELAPNLDGDGVRPHALRATAATNVASHGISMYALMQMFGWCQPATAEIYLARNVDNSARQLEAAYSR